MFEITDWDYEESPDAIISAARNLQKSVAVIYGVNPDAVTIILRQWLTSSTTVKLMPFVTNVAGRIPEELKRLPMSEISGPWFEFTRKPFN